MAKASLTAVLMRSAEEWATTAVSPGQAVTCTPYRATTITHSLVKHVVTAAYHHAHIVQNCASTCTHVI